MAPVRALSALAVLGALSGANAVVYNYNNGGQDWNTTGKAVNVTLAPPVGLCGNGTSQSPINVPLGTPSVAYNSTLKPLSVSYGPTSAWMMEVQANYLEVANINTNATGATTTTANAFTDGLTLPDGTFLPLNQFHFHTPSEHTINGMHYPLEMHMVHKLYQASAINTTIVPANTVGATLARAAVIGIMFAYDPMGQNASFMSKLSPVFQQMGGLGADDSDDFEVNATTYPPIGTTTSQFNLMTDIFGVVGTSNYYTYTGSLTTPTCNQGITWFLMANPMYASPLQILEYTSMLATEQNTLGRGTNNRLVQPLNGRVIQSSMSM